MLRAGARLPTEPRRTLALLLSGEGGEAVERDGDHPYVAYFLEESQTFLKDERARA